jgi:hypothetical protein
MKTIAAGAAMTGALGFAVLGIGAGVANAAPSPVGGGTQWALDRGWDHGRGWDNGPRRGEWRGEGPRWAPPPPPYYGYGGYNGGGCVSGPLGLLHFCP